MSPKNIDDRVKNNLLLLYLINKTNEIADVEDNLKVQKLVFLSQKKLIEKKIKGFSYNFFRWERGPFSANVSEDINGLIQDNFLSWGKGNIKLTKEGEKVLKECSEILESNHNVIQYVDQIVEEYGQLTPDEIKKYVYDLRIMVPRIRKLMRIEDIPMRTLILFKPSLKRVKRTFNVSDDWLVTLELILNPEARESLKRAQRDAREGRTSDICEI